MKKEELKNGQIVEFKYKGYGIMIGGTAIGFKGDAGGVSKDLMHSNCIALGSHPIIRVYEPQDDYPYNAGFSYWFTAGSMPYILEHCDIVWEYEEPTEEMTLEQVCKALGKDIKIIK